MSGYIAQWSNGVCAMVKNFMRDEQMVYAQWFDNYMRYEHMTYINSIAYREWVHG